MLVTQAPKPKKNKIKEKKPPGPRHATGTPPSATDDGELQHLHASKPPMRKCGSHDTTLSLGTKDFFF